MARSASARSTSACRVVPWPVRLCLVVLVAWSWAVRARAGGDFARQVLGARDKDDKEQKAVRGRKGGIEAEDALAIIRRERHPSTVSLCVGMYLEKSDYAVGKTAAVVRALAAREGFFGKAAVLAAWSPHVEKILRDLLASRSASSRGLAATIVATYAHADSLGNIGPGAKGGDKKKGDDKRDVAVARIDLDPTIAKLLADRSKDVQELAVLAAAYAELDTVRDRIVKLSTAGAPGLAGARLLYLAVLDEELPEETTRKVLAVRIPVPKRYARLTPLLHSYDVRGHALLYACQAVAEAADGRFTDRMHALLDHPDLRVQAEAARAIAAIGAPASVPVRLQTLQAEPPWPVRIALLSALGAIPAKESVPALLSTLKAELGRFRQDAAYALLSIVPQLDQELQFKWDAWWDEHGEAFEVDPEATRKFRDSKRVQDIEVASLTDFYGGKIISNRVVFVLDTSMSMKGDKIKSLKLTMSDTLERMPEHMKFNVVNFGGIVHVLRPGALIGARHRASANDAIQYMELSWGTRTFDAMEEGTRLPEMDTIVYLSDAAPVGGTFESWDRIVGVFGLYNRYRPVAIYCILYGGGKGAAAAGRAARAKGRAGGMARLADQNVGLMSVADQGGQVHREP